MPDWLTSITNDWRCTKKAKDGGSRTSWKTEREKSGSTIIDPTTISIHFARSSITGFVATERTMESRPRAVALLCKTLLATFGWEARQHLSDGGREGRKFTDRNRCDPTRETAASWRSRLRPMARSGSG